MTLGQNGAQRLKLRLSEVVNETAEAMSLIFEPADQATAMPSYHPGQFLTFRLPCGPDGNVSRCYSLSSSPFFLDKRLQITVKRVARGVGSNWLCDNAAPGLELEALSPVGNFFPENFDRDLLLVAAGSGITPIFSILTSALSQGIRKVALIYVNRSERAVIFDTALRTLACTHSDRLTVHHWHTAMTGRPSQADLMALMAPYAGFDAFVCGPRRFADTVQEALRANGVPESRVAVEEFLSLADDPFAAPPSTINEGRSSVDLRVDLYGTVHHLTWPEQTILLDLLLSLELDPPYLCREGACHTCTCTLAAGRVRTLFDDVVEAGNSSLILACQAVPDGSDVTVRFLNS